ncbi:MAG: orotidine-5'-phosphate decarboxylase [Gammaproteobacteria bacterium TMED112]|nr:MAG: orotidine-5'-phosphate decarboxylase [Gammaproteobacteria bacterium TMED112]|tara:strand:+ start:12624 stop:13277 length:654 start_codon:yes stop_codon:yes gene_type:complete
MSNKRLIIALDFKNIAEMSYFISNLDPKKCIVKVGLQLFIAEGPKVLDFLSQRDFEIFLDLKLHDIPNTVKKSVEEISQYNVKLTTIHLQGGQDMIQAANEAKGSTKILGVSLLTSLDESDIRKLYNNDFKKQFNNLINIAMETNIDGIVCSSQELELIQDPSLIKVVPGIRNQNSSDDQKRVMTSKEAYSKGADFIVVGRPITQAKDIEESIKDYS